MQMERCSHLGPHYLRYIRGKSTDRLTTYVLLCPLFSPKKYLIMLLNPAANSTVEQWNTVQCASKQVQNEAC